MKPLTNDPKEIKELEILNSYLGEFYQDEFGWELLVDEEIKVYHTLEEEYNVLRLAHSSGLIFASDIFEQRPREQDIAHFIEMAAPAYDKIDSIFGGMVDDGYY